MEIQVVAIDDHTSAGYPTQVGSDLVIPDCPVIPISSVKKYQTVLPLLEKVSVQNLEYTAAKSAYGFNIQQVINGVTQVTRIYVADAAALSDAEIATEIIRQVAWAQAAGVCEIVATDGTNLVALTAQAGSPTFVVTGITNMTLASGMTTKAIASSTGSTGGEVSVTVTAGHGLITGDLVTVSGGTAQLTTLNGNTYRVVRTSATVALLQGSQAASGTTGTGTLTYVACPARNETATLQTELDVTKGTGSLNATDNYGIVEITWTQYSQLEASPIAEQVRTLLVMFPSSLIASPYTNSGWQAALDAIL